MEQPKSRDLRSVSFDEFVSLIFNPAEQLKPDTRLCDIEVEIDATTYSCSGSRNFCLRDLQSRSLKKGSGKSWVTPTIGPLATLLNTLTRRYLAARRALSPWPFCLNAFFPKVDTSVHMWWDSLCYSWHCGNRKRERGGRVRSYAPSLIFPILSA